MSTLLISVFSFFWLHTILWWQRAFRENREKRIKGEHKEAHPPELALQGEVYQRFDWFGIVIHFLMLVSFLGLVFTGLPLKFFNAPWAPAVMKIWGGAENAGLVHRICALITFLYFGAVNVMVIYFLFFKKTGQTFLQKLFGPDSLFPNLQDLKDISRMFKWYFNLGPKPSFGRWTYWEKFDFLAVYWGMFAIGFTGLVLWFPTWFAKFFPGWLFNISTIMHSDEALLAAGFIFTVHFFNTHLRPEKFPMDVVIFTGKVTRHEMIEERPLQIKLEKERGIMEKMQTRYSGSAFEFISQVIGYAAVFLGFAGIYFMITGLFGK
jgi:cytochrome b subunit of formate dehydrogenase